MTTLSLAVGSALLFPPGGTASAGFLEDFYQDAGAQSAYTPAGIYASQSMETVTGGRYILKVPRQDFQPFYLQAPHLKAGCGGIDMFFGAFSIPSKEEFLNFVRGIGTALPGLAFHLSLQALAPDLNEQVSQFRDMLMRLSNGLGDSCQAAESLMSASGADTWIANMGHRARNALRANGTAEDASDALAMTKTDGERVLTSVPAQKDENGTVLEAPELNLTWALLSSGKAGQRIDRTRREVMMSLVGTTVFLNAGSGANMTTRTQTYAPLDLLNAMLGTETSASLPQDAVVYRCDEEKACLHPERVKADDINLTHAVFEAMLHYRQSLTNRNPALVSDREMVMLGTISSLPLLRIVELAASPRIVSFSDGMMASFAQVAAYEAILTAVSQLADDVRLAVTSSAGRNVNKHTLEHASRIEARLSDLKAELSARESVMAERMSRVTDIINHISHLNRAIYGDAAIEALHQLPGGGLTQ